MLWRQVARTFLADTNRRHAPGTNPITLFRLGDGAVLTMPTTVADLAGQIRPTPVVTVTVTCRGRVHRVLLKRECHLPTASIKYRTAVGLLREMDRISPLRPGTVVVESTSGGLGAALAHLLVPLGCELIAVIDPKTPAATRRELSAAGARLHCVTETDGYGGYLYTRLHLVHELCRANPDYRWPDQYGNPANPRIHQETTGPEIIAQGGPGLDAIYVAVSTGGTLAGIAAHVRSLGRPIRLVAVDAIGSQATGPQPNGWRHIPGIGSSRRATQLLPDSYDRAVHVPDAEAIALCHQFHADTGMRLGGSSGHVLRACLGELAGPRPPARPLCVCADDGDRYVDTVYNPAWPAAELLAAEIAAARAQFHRNGLTFSLDTA
jgi:N-(2-amino-2-carboxyethyl)-L-glutamate synthase